MNRMLHIRAEKGWINDPNGLCFFKGYYHVFFQCNPYGLEWAKMHWAHVRSRNLLNWEYCPLALVPEIECERGEKGGCFSGSAIEKDGLLYLVYTASDGLHQKVCVAYSQDGMEFKKYEGNPVLISSEYENDFRDPKVFFHEGLYYMVLGAYKKGSSGCILLYSSEDLLSWSFCGNIFSLDRSIGTMPECPDLFFLDGRWVLTFSPVDPGYDGYSSMAIIGTMDFSAHEFKAEKTIPIDYGKDYYASQSFLDEKGRRIAFAWAGSWQWLPEFNGFPIMDDHTGCLTMAREYHIRDGGFVSEPIDEIKALIKKERNDVRLLSGEKLSLGKKRHIGLKKTISGKREGKLLFSLSRNHFIIFDFRALNAVVLNIEGGGIKHSAIIPIPEEREFSLSLFYESPVLEMFLNNGEVSYTECIMLDDNDYSPCMECIDGDLSLTCF